MDTNKRIENLLRGITARVSKLDNGLPEVYQSKKPNSFKKLIIKISTFLLFSLPIGFQMNNFFAIRSSPIDLKISDVQAKSPKKGDKIYFFIDERAKSEQFYNFTFKLSGTITTYSGQIKDAYLIYSPHDDSEITENDFYSLPLTTKNYAGYLYVYNLLPYIPLWIQFPLSQSHFEQEINYQEKEKNFNKPIYLLTISNQNIPSLNVIIASVGSKMIIGKNSTSRTFPGTTEDPKFSMYSSEEFLKIKKMTNKDLPFISSEKYRKDTQRILNIARSYYLR